MLSRPSSQHRPHRARTAAVLAGAVVAATSALVATPGAQADTPVPTSVRIASFNVLGANHTTHSRRFAPAAQRMNGVLRLLANHSVEIVGFQEMQAEQLAAFQARTAGAFTVYSPPQLDRNGLPILRTDPDNSIAWNASEWQALAETYVTIPYFNGHPRAMPVVKLQNLSTGMTAWFADFHTPATNRNHPGQDAWRAQAISTVVALANQLRYTGLPVFITGDMNEREKAFCPIVGGAYMRAARGGSYRHGVCNAMHPWYVDWIFGVRRQTFTDYVEDAGPLDRRTSDHPMVVATAVIDPATFPRATVPVLPATPTY